VFLADEYLIHSTPLYLALRDCICLRNHFQLILARVPFEDALSCEYLHTLDLTVHLICRCILVGLVFRASLHLSHFAPFIESLFLTTKLRKTH